MKAVLTVPIIEVIAVRPLPTIPKSLPLLVHCACAPVVASNPAVSAAALTSIGIARRVKLVSTPLHAHCERILMRNIFPPHPEKPPIYKYASQIASPGLNYIYAKPQAAETNQILRSPIICYI